MNQENKIIGHIHKEYAEKRNSFGYQIKNYSFRQHKLGVFKILDFLFFKLTNRTYLFFHNLHFGYTSSDMYHFFNGIHLGNKPWVSTFETSIPRLKANKKWHLDLGVSALRKDNCKQLIALSNCSRKIQKNFLEENYPQYAESINRKTVVMHPSQNLLIKSYDEKTLGDKIIFTLIGADFFRKGGMEILNVFNELILSNQNVHLNIISTMQYGDYATHTDEKNQAQALDIINKHPNSISHYRYLPNNEVLTILLNSHIGLLPTYADTYGYSVLESQACGCPVISTDIRALPEINNETIGYVIPVPKDNYGNGQLETKIDRENFSSILESKLHETIVHILDNPNEIRIKGELCLEHIEKNHNPGNKALELQTIYNNALGLDNN